MFEQVRGELARQRKPPAGKPRKPVADFYRDDYVRAPADRAAADLVDLRRDGRISVVVIPERFDGGVLTPCAYIRLLQPLDHPAIGGDLDIVLADAEEALHYRADIIVTQRYAVADLDAADALIRALPRSRHVRCCTTSTTTCGTSRATIRTPRCCGRARGWCRAGARRRCGLGLDRRRWRTPGGPARRRARRGERPRRTALGGIAAPPARRGRGRCASCSWAPRPTMPISPSSSPRWRD